MCGQTARQPHREPRAHRPAPAPAARSESGHKAAKRKRSARPTDRPLPEMSPIRPRILPRPVRRKATHGSRCRAEQIAFGIAAARSRPARTEQARGGTSEKRWWVHILAATDPQISRSSTARLRSTPFCALDTDTRAFSMNDLSCSGVQAGRKKGKEGARENRPVLTPTMGIARHRQKCLRFLGVWRRVARIAPCALAAS